VSPTSDQEETIIISDPASRLNTFKRIVAICFGTTVWTALITLTCKGYFMDIVDHGEEALGLAALSLGLIYYGFRRSKIVKTLYLRFSENHIEGRFALRMEPEETMTMPWQFKKYFIKPCLADINIEIKDIKNIEIKALDINIRLTTGGEETMPLVGMNYKMVQRIKNRFRRVQESVHASGTA